MAGFREWVFDLRESGLSMAGAHQCVQVLEAIGHSTGMSADEKCDFDNARTLIFKFEKKWTVQRRHAMTEEEMMRAAFNPPKQWSERLKQLWTFAIIISWVFLLRGMEIKHITPGDINVKPEGVTCKVTNPKIGTAHQHTTIPTQYIPQKAMDFVRDYASLANDPEMANAKLFSALPDNLAQLLRAALNLPNSRSDVVWHSIRHGRAFHLHHTPGVSLQDLQCMGRWRRLASVMVYIHH